MTDVEEERERNTSRMAFNRICLGKVEDPNNWDGAGWRKMRFGGMERLITLALNMLGCAFVISKWCC